MFRHPVNTYTCKACKVFIFKIRVFSRMNGGLKMKTWHAEYSVQGSDYTAVIRAETSLDALNTVDARHPDADYIEVTLLKGVK